MSVVKKRSRTALPKEPVPPVISNVLFLNIASSSYIKNNISYIKITLLIYKLLSSLQSSTCLLV